MSVPDPPGHAPQGERRRGSGGGMAPVAIGGGTIGVVGILVYLAIVLTGARQHTFSALEGVTVASPRQTASSTLGTDCAVAATDTVRRDCRILTAVDSAQDYWRGWFTAHGRPYRRAETVFFDGLTGTACGAASGDVGPFYCPADDTIYIDLGFYQVLESRFPARAPFAEAYVVAHEFGHHVQHLLGVPGSYGALAIELQADCYAGVWAHHAAMTGAIDRLTPQQIRQGLAATASVGAARIQSEAEHQVDAETWNQGSPAERRSAFLRGYARGEPAACSPAGGAL